MDCASLRELEITVISGEGLRVNGKRVKKNAYVIIRTDSRNCRTTRMDKDGGSYPAWNERLAIGMPMHARFLTMEVLCNKCMIGTARIPVTDFIDGVLPENYLHFLSYRLRDVNGERNGIINLSVKVNVPERNGYKSGYCARPWTEAPPMVGNTQAGKLDDSSRVVTGVPLWIRPQV